MARRKSSVAAIASPGPAEPTAPARLDNAARVSRQREAFADAPPSPPIAAAPAPPAAPARARRQPPRRVSAEVVRAETRLLDLDRRRRESLEHHETVWAGKRAALLGSLPADVMAALVAMKVIEPEAVTREANGASPSAPAGNEGAAVPANDAAAGPLPPPEASAPIAAPDVPHDAGQIVEVHEALAQVDEAWSGRGLGATIAAWTDEQRLAALTWAQAVIHDGPMRIQGQRPAHTLITLQHREEG